MAYSPVDSENCTGTFTAPDSSTYTTSMQMTSSTLTFSWSGPSSGSFTVDLNSDGTIAPSSIHPMSTCGDLGRLSATFAVAGLFLTVISLGTMALVYGVISAGIGVYAAVKCA